MDDHRACRLRSDNIINEHTLGLAVVGILQAPIGILSNSKQLFHIRHIR